jgi:hypothetical protein
LINGGTQSQITVHQQPLGAQLDHIAALRGAAAIR